MNLFYIENTYNGTNTVTLTTLKTGSPASGTYATSVEYSKDGSSWSTFNLTDSGTNTVTLDENEKVYFRNNSGYWNNYTSAFVQHLKIFTANQSHKIGGDLRSLIDYTDDYVDLKSECFVRLFNNDTNLTDASDLEMGQSYNITSVKSYTCFRMFDGCTGLITPPSLPFSTLGDTCYMNMFKDCTSLTTAPTLPATTLAEDCYGNMFYGCTSLNEVTTYANDISASNCLYEWLANVAATGTFYNLGSATYPTNSTSGIPTGWTQKSSIPDYFYIENTYSGSNTVTLSTTQSGSPTAGTYATSVQYSKDKNSWTTLTLTAGGTNTITLNQGEKVYFRNDSGKWNYYLTSSNYFETKITANQTHTVGGNINTLLDYTDLNNVSLSTGCFSDLFFRDSSMTSASSLSLPSTTLAQNCYKQMFFGCSNLTATPTLPATTLADGCYSGMFQSCTSLTPAPSLPATTLADSCYSNMFWKCTALTTAPALPATTLADGCYSGMFQSCTSLTTAPALPATTLASNCYEAMFYGCRNLTSAPSLPATTLADGCYSGMFQICTSLTTAPALPATTLAQSCYYQMFSGCTSLTTAPILPATTLAEDCYSIMFSGCTSLTTAPALPATTLATGCYSAMFYGCTLTTAPSLPATTLSSYCYNNMFSDCTHLTTAPSLPATTLVNNCYQGMFSGCTSLTTAPALPATTLASNCYQNMFNGCTALTTAPSLPATTLAQNCYYQMFSGCTSLTSAPTLPATTLASYCYSNMFYGCRNLTTAPALPATTLAQSCYGAMFYGCTSLNEVTTYADDISASNCTFIWLYDVAATGTFHNLGSATYTPNSVSGIPTGWTEVGPTPSTYTITATAGSNGSISPSGAVSVNVGSSQTFTVTPDTGYIVDTLTVDGSTATLTNNTYTFSNVQADHTISVTFKVQTFTISAISEGHTTVNPSGLVTVNYGADQTFTFSPAIGYELDKLYIDGVETAFSGSSYTFTNVQSDHTLEITSKIMTFTLTSSAGQNGSISPSGSTTVNYGSSQTYTITPDTGYEIDTLTVDGSTVTSNTTYTFSNITANHTISVTFKKQTFTIEASCSEGGEISPDGTVTVDYDGNATFEITPSTGYLLWELLVDGVDKKDELVDNTYTFENVTANHTIHAVFDDIYLIVSVTSGPNGSITPTGDVEVIYNGNQIFNITPNEGYEIDKVMLDGVDVTDDVEDFNYTMRNIVENHLLEVTFKEKVIPTTNGFNFDQFKNRDYVKQYYKK